MSSNLSIAEARKRLQAAQEALRVLAAEYPAFVAPITLFGASGLSASTRYRIMRKFMDHGLAMAQGSTASRTYQANIEKIGPLLEDEQAVAALLRSDVTESLPDATGSSQMEMPTLQPPPPVEGMQRPPQGAPPEVVLEWVFTLLHAQAENFIYVREKVDRLEARVDRAVEILEKLL